MDIEGTTSALPRRQWLTPPTGCDLVIALDTLIAGVHFLPDTPAADVGYKALAVNLSDMAAMGAEPVRASIAFVLSERGDAWVRGFFAGFTPLAQRFDMGIGDIDIEHGPLSVSVHIEGFVPHGGAVRRSGARPDDAVYVTGTLGDAGLALLERTGRATVADRYVDTLHRRLDRPAPRVVEGLALRGMVSAAIDISDGLLSDLGHVAKASNVGFRIWLDKLPLSRALEQSVAPEQAWSLAVSAGDDYELCFTLPVEHALSLHGRAWGLGTRVTHIGYAEHGRGVQCFQPDGSLYTGQAGYLHFGSGG